MWGSRSRILNSLGEQDINILTAKIYLYAKELNKQKYQSLIKKCKETGLYLNKPNSKVFIKYWNTMDDV